MRTVAIYQLPLECKYIFRNYKFANKHGFSLEDYKLTYLTRRSGSYGAENCYAEFNLNRPQDFDGHSLSVSDIVEIDDVKYYCDDMGWVEIK